jgi:hypothetical protein
LLAASASICTGAVRGWVSLLRLPLVAVVPHLLRVQRKRFHFVGRRRQRVGTAA